MLRCLVLTLALVSVSYALKCYSGCVAGTMTMGGNEQPYPGGSCNAETVEECEQGCATAYLAFDYSMEVSGSKMAGSADTKTAMCSMGGMNKNLCDQMETTLEASMGALTNLKCKITSCDKEKCNDLSKSAEDDNDSGSGSGGKSESDGADEESSFALHGVSFLLFSAVFGLLF